MASPVPQTVASPVPHMGIVVPHMGIVGSRSVTDGKDGNELTGCFLPRPFLRSAASRPGKLQPNSSAQGPRAVVCAGSL